MGLVDGVMSACLLPLAVWILVSGLDDLVLDVTFLVLWLRRRRARTDEPRPGEPERRIAVFVALWREHAVIGRMLEHNIAAIHYQNYDFFIGAYPNDEPTIAAVGAMEARFERVHLSVCPHDGPTSKADCLNWVYQRMLLFEEEHGVRFDLVVTHDAEDLIHADSLAWFNHYAGRYDMIQIPVLPLRTPFWNLTHGVYCDEFSESHLKDLPAREILGGFIPSAGVGTAFTRAALEALAAADANRIFDPASLTEDYENGLRLCLLGFRQRFVPIRFRDGAPVATRGYFPRGPAGARKQRTRWIMGIALQSWERRGWRVGWRQAYWLWRDRKGLAGNPLSVVANWIFFYGLVTWAAGRPPWPEWFLPIAWITAALQFERLGVRASCTAQVFGWGFALGVPLRVLLANWINCRATLSALFRYASARLRGEPLVWIKTEHAFPTRAALLAHRRKLGDVLVGSGYLSSADLSLALVAKPPELRLGDYLLRVGKLSEEELYEALALQQSIPTGAIRARDIEPRVARALPVQVLREWNVLPFRIEKGRISLAGPEIPSDEMRRRLHQFTRLEIHFQLITPRNFEELRDALL